MPLKIKLPSFFFLLSSLTLCAPGAPGFPGTNPDDPQLQTFSGQVVNEKGEAIPGAVCTLSGRSLPDQGLSMTADEKGGFQFPGLPPGSYDLVCAAVGYQPVAQSGLEVTQSEGPTIQLVLPKEIIVREKVEVREKAPPVSQQSAGPPAALSSKQLRSLPLAQQKFKAALPLLPGVIRTPDGRINIKGSAENQGMLLVDSAETVDPVTGSFSIEVPIDAVESLEVYKSAYRAEYGRFSGGLTTIETKPPSSQWKFELNDFLPTLRGRSGHIVGIADNKPRLRFTGPIWPGKLNFSESFSYEVLKTPVRGLAWPNNETKTQGFDSFTDFQYFFSPQHFLTTNVNVFPLRHQFMDINSLVPQSASSDYGQRGYSIGATDRLMLSAGGILTTLVKYTDFHSNAYGQGPDPMLLTPNGRGGNFFNTWTRSSNQEEIDQTFEFPRKDGWGRHDVKFGGDFAHRAYQGTSVSHPVLLLRADGSLAEQISFQGPGVLEARDTELAAFVQDHWALRDQLALDMGLRFSGQTLGETAAIAPRAGIVYSPGSDGKTIVRSGVGVFYDRLPLLAGDFTNNPTRVVTCFDPECAVQGSPYAYQNVYVRVDEKGRHIIPLGRNLGSTPYNLTWSVEADRELRPHMVARVSFLSSRTLNEFIVDPQIMPGSQPILLMTNTGRSRYQELESTLRMRPSEKADFNISYVHSRARGDLNTLGQVFVPFEQPVIRPNFFAALPSNVPHRLITWGRFKLPGQFTASPLIDLHSGFPYSQVDALQNYAGTPNGRRFPTFFSLDLQITKDFRFPVFPWLKNRKLRAGFQVFNVTNHSNPRDVFSNIASPFFGHLVGFQHRLYDLSFDIVY
jgi:carboxypeptidase family protein/TonB-dependent receptor-like protein